MNVTYTPLAARGLSKAATRIRHLEVEHVLLAATSVLAVLAIGLAYNGRLHTVTTSAGHQTAPVNIDAATSANDLEPALVPLLPHPPDRHFAAQHLFAFLQSVHDSGRAISNVGLIAAATVQADDIRRTPLLVHYRDLLQQADERAATSTRAPPAVIPLFDPVDIATIKPQVVVRTPEAFARATWIWGAAVIVIFWLVALLWRIRSCRGDYVLLAAAHILTAIGFATLLARPDPLRDTMLVARYAEGVIIGVACFGLISVWNIRKAAIASFSYLPLIAALGLCALLVLFGSGPGRSTAKVNLGPVQPIEAIRLLLALFLAGYFARRWEVLRQLRARVVRDRRVPGWLALPQLAYVLPVVAGVGAALLLFFLQKDLGPALFLSCVFLATYALARKRIGMAVAGLAVLIAGFTVGYALNISSTLTARVHMWASPWNNGVAGGDHVAQALWAVSTGGLFGSGLGLGSTRYISAGHTDLVLASIGEEMGFIGLLLIATVYVVIAVRGFRAALRAADDYGFFLAATLTLFLVLPVVVMAGGMLGLIPLTGIVTPFLSYGGSAMVANFFALGLITALGAGEPSRSIIEPFHAPTRALSGVLGTAAVALLLVLFKIQVVSGAEYMVRPHLGLQADGIRRYQYNQRVLDAVGLIPRGTVVDRRNLPLATGDPIIARRAGTEYGKYGIRVDASCTPPIERCYPLGASAFHLLGDARSRMNWSASNTAFVERDAEDRLRGFDDRAMVLQSRDAAGRAVPTIRRDYSDLVALVRHRHDLDDGNAAAILARRRDLALTLDARLQDRVSTILARYASRSQSGHAAAVVIDPDTGDLLASATYPLPSLTLTATDDDSRADAMLDRARFGLYPPGSTFKLVTAAAALRTHPSASNTRFMCRVLHDGRVGTTIPGWSRPVRDDVLDTHAHGNIDMHEAIAESCNAYFAQLAVQLGPQALLDTAARLGIAAAPGNSLARLRDTLPQAGYGQGDVLATPLRLARLAGAIANHGVLRETRLHLDAAHPARADVFLSPAAADILARDLRDAVLSGTGRSLRGHPSRIAGKTGTAEVTGASSHAWFVGFAPFGQAEKRVAFAVIIENAGYGGLAAAPVAGDIVSAATDLGLAR